MGEPNIAAHLSVVADADDETRREVARHADRIRLALATLDDGVAPTTGADEIEAVAGELASLAATAPTDRAEAKRQRWGAVATAQAELKRLDAVGPRSAATVSAAALAHLESLHAEREAAEAKARSPLSGSRAFKRFVQLRRQEEQAFAAAGVESIDQARAAADTTGDAEAAQAERRRAERTLAAAEAAWAAFEDRPDEVLPSGPAADAVRARAYQALGAVVADEDLAPELDRAARRARDAEAARTLLESAIRSLGLAPGDDPVGVARSILAVVDRS